MMPVPNESSGEKNKYIYVFICVCMSEREKETDRRRLVNDIGYRHYPVTVRMGIFQVCRVEFPIHPEQDKADN